MGQGRIGLGRKGLAARLLSMLLGALFLIAPPVHAYHAASSAQHAAELALYTLPDGSAPVLCLGDGGSDGGHAKDTASCPLCRIVGAAALAAPDIDYDLCRFATRLDLHPHAGHTVRPPLRVALAPPTGPPLS